MDGAPIEDRKRTLRREMRALRRALPDREERSHRLWERVRALPAVAAANAVMVFDSIPGEPETAPFIAWCLEQGKTVHLPEDEPPPDPRTIDVVIVPGTAFTRDGHRLGQGGGWYDRFLRTVRPDCVTIGVAFRPQIVEELPVEPHDIRIAIVVSDASEDDVS
ncbi:MAG TPA: 5-formyltetrahydrofolate cyclo-ligase [Ilumatobacter sp.]|nr:5-formyltetrahydrofolate cyclo-ligase [Ilumatobacter sp.]